MIKEVFLDLDGCVFNFEKRFYELFRQHSEVNYPLSNNARSKRFKQEFKEFVEGNNFATLEPMPDFGFAVPFLNRVSKTVPIFILSSTATAEYQTEISKQKKECLKKYDIRFPTIFVPGKRLKKLYSGNGRILIDDTKQNVDDWINNGGIGIRHLSWKNTIEEFNKLKNKNTPQAPSEDV